MVKDLGGWEEKGTTKETNNCDQCDKLKELARVVRALHKMSLSFGHKSSLETRFYVLFFGQVLGHSTEKCQDCSKTLRALQGTTLLVSFYRSQYTQPTLANNNAYEIALTLMHQTL